MRPPGPATSTIATRADPVSRWRTTWSSRWRSVGDAPTWPSHRFTFARRSCGGNDDIDNSRGGCPSIAIVAYLDASFAPTCFHPCGRLQRIVSCRDAAVDAGIFGTVYVTTDSSCPHPPTRMATAIQETRAVRREEQRMGCMSPRPSSQHVVVDPFVDPPSQHFFGARATWPLRLRSRPRLRQTAIRSFAGTKCSAPRGPAGCQASSTASGVSAVPRNNTPSGCICWRVRRSMFRRPGSSK